MGAQLQHLEQVWLKAGNAVEKARNNLIKKETWDQNLLWLIRHLQMSLPTSALLRSRGSGRGRRSWAGGDVGEHHYVCCGEMCRQMDPAVGHGPICMWWPSTSLPSWTSQHILMPKLQSQRNRIVFFLTTRSQLLFVCPKTSKMGFL